MNFRFRFLPRSVRSLGVGTGIAVACAVAASAVAAFGSSAVAQQNGVQPRWVQIGCTPQTVHLWGESLVDKHTSLVAIYAFLAASPNAVSSVTEVERKRIEAAAPDRPSVKPTNPRKILVFSRAWGYKHSSIPYGEVALEIMGRKTGAFSTVVTDDERYFEADELSRFDAVVLNNSNNEVFLPETFTDLTAEEQAAARVKDRRLRANLKDFISNGKGLAVIHAGIATFRKWPEFGEIMGARFDNHPWNAGSTVTLKVEEPAHPVARAFGSSKFQITDEIYQFTGNYSRSQLRVLISLDTALTDMNKGAAIHRTDNDFALGWIRRYGDGRVFYCALGHQHSIFWNRTVLRHYLDGIQFAIGDLKADASPRLRPQ